MSVYFTRSGCAALFLAFSSHGAWADLTANDVWSDWQTYVSSMGYDITGTETMTGDTLRISNLEYTISLPNEGVDLSVKVSELSMTENRDGTVSISIPPSQLLSFFIAIKDEGDAKIDLTYSQIGLVMTVSGDPGNMTYDYSANSLSIDLASLEIDGQATPEFEANASLTLNNVAGQSVMAASDGGRASTSQMTIASLNYEIKANNPDGDETFEAQGQSENLTMESTFALPDMADTSDMQALLKAGFTAAGKFSFGAGNYNMVATGSEGGTINGSSQGGTFEATIDSTHLLYDFAINMVAMSMTASELPFPVSFNFAKYAFRMDMPLGESSDIKDFALAQTLQDFSMADLLWGLFDPTGTLPHDPATISVDISGKARVLVDIFDPDIETVMSKLGHPPAELHALTLNNLLISAVGAELSGTGDFTFDNNDMTTFDGMPAPAGTLALKLSGANTLLDNLVAMGLIGDGEVMGARMGMGMLAVPGDGKDTLISNIEITTDGHITANGQRIK